LSSPSLRSLVADLLGQDPDETCDRPTVARAARPAVPGSVIAARRGKKRVAVVTLHDGRQYVVPDRCPHDGGLLSDGFVDRDRLVCARHGWEFDVESGECPGRGACLESARLALRARDS